jgi:hypothetical protein
MRAVCPLVDASDRADAVREKGFWFGRCIPEAAQHADAWLSTAEGIAEAAEAAEAIAASQAALEDDYQRAYEAAVAEAEASANGMAEIRSS